MGNQLGCWQWCGYDMVMHHNQALLAAIKGATILMEQHDLLFLLPMVVAMASTTELAMTLKKIITMYPHVLPKVMISIKM